MTPGIEKSPLPCLLRFNVRCTIKSSHLDNGQKKYFSLRLLKIFSLIDFFRLLDTSLKIR